MMIRLCLAFELDLAQARCAVVWAGLGLGGQVPDEQLEATVGPRFIARSGGMELSSSDVYRQARRQYRIRTLVDGDGIRPLTFRRTFHVCSYGQEAGRLALRSWDGRAGFGALEVEFGGVLEMKLRPGFRGGALSITEESAATADSGADGIPGRLFLLSDGTVQGAFVRCGSVRVYRSEPDGGLGTGTEPPEAWGP